MRNYNNKTIKDGSDFDDFILPISEQDTTISIRDEYYYHYDDGCYWAKEIDGIIFYSRDDVYDTEKEDSTHIVIFMK